MNNSNQREDWKDTIKFRIIWLYAHLVLDILTLVFYPKLKCDQYIKLTEFRPSLIQHP